MNYYPFHIGDYISHTSHLSDAEDLAYRRMIDLYYQTEEPFTDISTVSRKVKSTFEIVSQLLHEFFVFQEEAWHNTRADEEIAKYRLKAESARNANRIKSEKKSAMKSVLKSEPNQNVTNNQEPITSSDKTKVSKTRKQRIAMALNKDTMPEIYEEFIRDERPDLDPLQTYYKFCDYWIGNGETKADWLATWRNWVRNEKKQYQPKQTTQDIMRFAK